MSTPNGILSFIMSAKFKSNCLDQLNMVTLASTSLKDTFKKVGFRPKVALNNLYKIIRFSSYQSSSTAGGDNKVI